MPDSRKPSASGIKFDSDNWFDEYINYRKAYPLSLNIPDPKAVGLSPEDLERFESSQHPLYLMLLRSGLIYGFPFLYPFRPVPSKKMSRKGMTKMLLGDVLLFSVLEHDKDSTIPYEDQVEQAGELIKHYVRNLTKHEGKSEGETIGRLISQHIAFRRNWVDWKRSGINCYLFWDWYCFRQYLESKDKEETSSVLFFEQLVRDRRQLKTLTMQFIAAAAHSDNKIEKSEKVLQHHFQKSVPFLTYMELSKLRQDFEEGVQLEDIDLPSLDWPARRYLLDISLVTLFSDKEINEAEEAFLKELLLKLDLEEEDLMESKLALGGFLMRYGRKLPFFDNKKASAALIAKAVSDNLLTLQSATKGEYQETVEMATAFGNLLQHQLGIRKDGKVPSEAEIARALDQITDLPRFLPFFSMAFVPVPGVTEMYIMLAYSIERITGDRIRLLPTNFSKMVRRKHKK